VENAALEILAAAYRRPLCLAGASTTLETAEGGFHVGIRRKLAARSLCKPLAYGGKMSGIDLLRLAVICRHLKA